MSFLTPPLDERNDGIHSYLHGYPGGWSVVEMGMKKHTLIYHMCDILFQANLNGWEEKMWAVGKDIMTKLAEVSEMAKIPPSIALKGFCN